MKMYRYQMNVNKTRIAVGGNYVWNIRAPIDVEKMKKAAPYFVGTHDFTSFTSPSAIVGKNPVRTIVRVCIIMHQILMKIFNVLVFLFSRRFLRRMDYCYTR